MPRRFIFTDEAGDFAFKRGPNIPNYFIVCSVTMDSCDLGETLLRLRRELAWEKQPLQDCFHAAEDKQVIRDRVFEGWYHFKHIGPRIISRTDELLLTTASIGTKKGQAVYTAAVNDVVQQVLPGLKWVTTFAPAACDPCLQIADYCTWAIQRKWEKADTRSYALIQGRITSEFNLWRHGKKYYY